MDELEAITESLRRQRKDLDTLLEETASRGDETAKVIEKLDELRKRAEQTADEVAERDADPRR
ncbi:MAG TPA: hypothetical protein VF911_11625 [Thermoanaerobaculia bacterium]|jgi:ABC-type transporter Mla subunit MlaD